VCVDVLSRKSAQHKREKKKKSGQPGGTDGDQSAPSAAATSGEKKKPQKASRSTSVVARLAASLISEENPTSKLETRSDASPRRSTELDGKYEEPTTAKSEASALAEGAWTPVGGKRGTHKSRAPAPTPSSKPRAQKRIHADADDDKAVPRTRAQLAPHLFTVCALVWPLVCASRPPKLESCLMSCSKVSRT
jgi:hypothetical protein